MKRYEELAEILARDIRAGNLPPGTRMPSIRKTVAQYGVSPSTAFQAYYRLEERGLVRARERSGYYVAGAAGLPLPRPAARRTRRASTEVDVSKLVFAVLEAAADQRMVQFGSAFPAPELFPWERLGKSLARAGREIDPWQSVDDLPPGNTVLRQQIALRYLGAGVPQAAEDIIVTNGALEALNLCLMAVARPGDVIAIESPGFYAALQALERLRLKAVEIPVHPQQGIDLAALAEALRRHPVRACWFMTQFQNPMGASMDEARKRELVALLARHQVPLIEDDVYGELYYGSRCPLPAKAFDTQGLVMHCSSFSKTLAPGFRIGWVAPGRFGEPIQRMKLMTTLSAAVPAQQALAEYLQHGGYDKHLRRLRHVLEMQQGQMRQAIARHFPASVRVSRPDGGYFLWVEFEAGFDALALHRAALEEGIGIAPGPIFSARQGHRHCVRLNFGQLWSPRSEAAIATLGRLAAAQ
ncbi:GntR family transcriptional regulator [Cupriavidus sp. USMAA2-4]|uniref:GntR family transcriptional regulator n=1 Tax=Cupriavidus malaysiensis TaxID=367825 RepID=A0ABN4TGP8_9BURK|nr:MULTISPECIES: PLP-dependent aminotransferase family protein [Cupriavidus]AOY90681.1 GntR family transcriptional regulator [Cupriavidus sp. USMAA2-4]AOZ06317.1 GntR family transcriptional regulator [Cupriavidus malaysiensis]